MAETDRIEEYLVRALQRHLPESSNLDIAELAKNMRSELTDVNWLADRMQVSLSAARVQRSRWKEAFPEPVVQRHSFWLKDEVEEFIQGRESYTGPGKPLKTARKRSED